MSGRIISADNHYAELDNYIKESACQSVMLVCDESLRFLDIRHYFDTLTDRLHVALTRFSDFKPNPLYESVEKGVGLFRRNRCDSIIAVGGGSAMDVAKCIKLYSNMDSGENYLKQAIVPNDVPLLAVPTTAGTGSEATRFSFLWNRSMISLIHEATSSLINDADLPASMAFKNATSSCLIPSPSNWKKYRLLSAGFSYLISK